MKKLTVPVLLCGTAETQADLWHACGFKSHDPVLCLFRGRQRWLIVPGMELGRARQESRAGTRVLTPDALGLSRRSRRRLSEWALALLVREGIKRIVVPSYFPFGLARRLEARGVRVAVATVPVCPGREVKTAGELARIREVQAAAAAAMQAATQRLRAARIGRDGCLYQGRTVLTAECLRDTIRGVLMAHRCVTSDLIVAGGAQGADPHQVGSGPLRARTPIVIDIFPRHIEHGFWGDLTRTVCRGEPGDEWRRRYRAVQAAQRAALRALRPGVTGGALYRIAHEVFVRRGYPQEDRNGLPAGFIHSLGHGVGLEIHESPALSPGNAARLRAGQVVTVEPGLYYPGEGGIRIEDTVAVRAGGWSALAHCPQEFVFS